MARTVKGWLAAGLPAMATRGLLITGCCALADGARQPLTVTRTSRTASQRRPWLLVATANTGWLSRRRMRVFTLTGAGPA